MLARRATISCALTLILSVLTGDARSDDAPTAPDALEAKVRTLLECVAPREELGEAVRTALRRVEGDSGPRERHNDLLDLDGLVDRLALVYLTHLDEEALDALLTLCEMPAGRRAAAATLGLQTGVHDAIQNWARSLAARSELEPGFDRVGPPLPDAMRTVREVAASIKGLGAVVTKMDVTKHSASFRIRVTKAAAFDRVRLALEQSPYLRERALDLGHIVDTGKTRSQDESWVREFKVRFRDDWWGDGLPAEADSISVEVMQSAAEVAGLRQIYFSRERETTARRWGAYVLSRRFLYDWVDADLANRTLASLEELAAAIMSAGPYRVTAVAWRLGEDGVGMKYPPRITVAAWCRRP